MKTLNPYRDGLRQILKRAYWDCTPSSHISRRRLTKLHNVKVGKKAVIMCNGPSLRRTDFTLLKGVDVFGLNKINLIFEETDFRPNFIVAVNNYVLEQNKEFFNATDLPLFLGWRAGKFGIKLRRNIFFQTIDEGFAELATFSLGLGSTVTFVAMQIAFHMGYDEVALIGCDHHFETSGPADKLVTAVGADPNHFHPDYFSGGVKWNLPDLVNSERAYLLAKKVFEENGRRIVNATEGGKLEVFDRCSLRSFVTNPQFTEQV